MSLSFDVVIPTVGRPELARLLYALASQSGPLPQHVFVVDDRAAPREPLGVDAGGWLRDRVRVVASGGRGPAAARNRGWSCSRAEWIAFLDDDVVPLPGWLDALACDLTRVDADASTGQIHVPLPRHRAPTDWERDVAGLERAAFATADMAYRRSVLGAVRGFDEGFPYAYREDADLALRAVEAGFVIVPGTRAVEHPVRRARRSVSVTRQRGNASDARMRAKHGTGWRGRAHVPRGRLPLHVATCAAATVGLGAALTQRRRLAGMASLAWGALTVDFAARRIAPGPKTFAEIVTVAATSVAIPPVAVWHRLRGEIGERRPRHERLEVVLVDRDGTIVVDHPYNGDPARVEPVGDARAALARLRDHGIAVGVVSNQSGIARGTLTHQQVEAVNARVEALLGPFDGWWYCPHDDDARCACRKPAPGMVLRALRHFGVRPEHAALIGDTRADIDAARAAGIRAILVPNPATRIEEIETAPAVAPTLDAAVCMLIGGAR